jgi:hypothetical protein
VDPGSQKLELFFDYVFAWEPVLREIAELDNKKEDHAN